MSEVLEYQWAIPLLFGAFGVGIVFSDPTFSVWGKRESKGKEKHDYIA